MKKKTHRSIKVSFSVLCFSGILSLFSCAEDLKPYESGDFTAPNKVLVAGEDSSFKRRVLQNVIDTLGSPEWNFQVIGLGELAEIDTQEYGAILILGRFWAGKIDGPVASYLQSDPSNKKVILLLTAGANVPISELGGGKLDIRVDAVSSASKDNLIKSKSADLTELIRLRF